MVIMEKRLLHSHSLVHCTLYFGVAIFLHEFVFGYPAMRAKMSATF